MRELIRDECLLELCPPGIHQRNIAKVAIKSFKKHFLSVLAGLPENFPWSFWDRLLPQTETTLNLLRQSNSTLTVSAYAHMHGNFDYNRMPLATMGCPVQVHVKSKDRKTFDFHSEPGHYLFTSPDHYRVHNNVMKKTKAERLSDAVVFQHRKINPPQVTRGTLVIKALASFLESLRGATKGFQKAAKKNNVNLRDIEQLAELTSRVTARLPAVTN